MGERSSALEAASGIRIRQPLLTDLIKDRVIRCVYLGCYFYMTYSVNLHVLV